jgi:hypothetical protein
MAAQVPQAPPIVPQAPVVPFALTPAIAIPGVIDYTTREGQKLYSNATYKLDDEPYDCQADGLYQFLATLHLRAQEFGWNDPINGILQIPERPADDNTPHIYLIDNYGQIPLTTIREFETTYLQTSCRPAQDTIMLFKCLMNSISKEAKNKILIWRNQYSINGYSSGNLLLKIIIRESHLDTNATTSSIRTKLSRLDTYIVTIASDITKFNGYVRFLIDSLAARGETSNDLLTNLFKGYGAATDKVFVDYIGRKLEKYEEGENTTADTLMEQANSKYKLMKEQSTWNAPSEQEEKILALMTEVRNLKKVKKKEPSSWKKEDKDKNKPKSKHKKAVDKPSWFNEEPSQEDLTKPKEWNGKTWYYCSPKTGGKCSGNYRMHKPSKCEGKAHKFAAREEHKRKAESPPADTKIKLAKAYETRIEPNSNYMDEMDMRGDSE